MDGFTVRFEHTAQIPMQMCTANRFSSLAGLSERIRQCITAPWRVRTKEVKALTSPARIGYTTW